jgi:hypothetical protein
MQQTTDILSKGFEGYVFDSTGLLTALMRFETDSL